MNVYDSEQIIMLMTPLGYCKTSEVKKADVVILNTCTIREKAEQKAYSFLGRLADMKQKRPEMIIAVGGCMAQQEGNQILKRVPYADIVFGTHAVGRLPQMISTVTDRRCRVVDVEMTAEIEEFELSPSESKGTGISRFVTIMQGCDNFCTYCVVPYVRGREASRKPEQIVREIEQLTSAGVKEVTLLGQNVNSYGQKEGLCSFPELLAVINKIDGLERIRFTTSHPKDLSPELMKAFAELDKVCNHIHLPVQSGSNSVLKRMNRKYTRENYLERVHELRRHQPGIAISSDFIVGFPGEAEADFEATLDLIRTVRFDSLFAFMYSDRPNAPAARFDDKVPEEIRSRRLQTLLKLQEQYTLEANHALKGTVQEILVEGMHQRPSKIKDDTQQYQWSGRTPCCKIVNAPADKGPKNMNKHLIGQKVNVLIEDAFCHSLRGTLSDLPPQEMKGDGYAS
jgi:tRNA-2-methylthio-N6-dimethylallyladenosine synthase